ncbi:2OG-Fe(II) oxygenase family protein [Candidatus Pelagibacter bacterium]|nr:2OG-Fe(II) oxygenase family protein [Candidatus Pelagibacter bacterium]
MQKIFNFFPLSIYKSTISIPQAEKDNMVNEILKMENNSKNYDYKTNDSAWTGDTQGHEFLHENKEFNKLFLEIEKNIKEYLENFSIDHTQLDLYFQRSWATISRKNENIANHRHAQSHLSFAYYLKKNKDDSKISFFDHSRHNEFIPGFLDSLSVQKKNLIKSRNVLNSPTILFDTKEDDIVIFPSKTLHGTQRGVLNNERISVSADIMIVAKNSENLEHLVTPIDKWKIFSS